MSEERTSEQPTATTAAERTLIRRVSRTARKALYPTLQADNTDAATNAVVVTRKRELASVMCGGGGGVELA